MTISSSAKHARPEERPEIDPADQYWTNFASQAAPAASAWPRFDRIGQQMLSLVAPQPQVETSFAAGHHCAFWARSAR